MGNKHESFQAEEVLKIADVAGLLWQKGWAERNAGNISVRLDDESMKQSVPEGKHRFHLLHKPCSALAGKLFLVTGTNTRMRDVATSPHENILLIRISDDGKEFSVILPAGETSLMPTSELASHLGIHEMLIKRRPGHRVVMHTHATELIALTQIRELCNGPAINRILLGMHPETRIFVPAGVGYVPYLLPGTSEIGEQTVKALTDHDAAIWEKHGVFATGTDPQETFDTIDMLAKSATVWFMCRSAGYEPEGLSETQLNELSKLKL